MAFCKHLPKAAMQLHPHSLPELRTLRQRAIALAMLDAIICPEFQYRYFSFDAAWSVGEEMASMNNGEGDHWFLHLSEAGAAIKGYTLETSGHDARALAMATQRALPDAFASFLHEPAFSMETVSFCYWRRHGDPAWSQVAHPDPAMRQLDDGSSAYLSILLAPASCYYDYASDYFECEPPLASIEHIYQHLPLTAALVKSLNPQLSLVQAQVAAIQIGYPHVTAEAAVPCLGH
ncbi:MAG: hypothetical protein ABIT83_23710 [Massilia sp.]